MASTAKRTKKSAIRVAREQPANRPAGGGKPKWNPPANELRALAVAGCSQEEAASFFDVGYSTFKRLLKESPTHRRAWEDGARKRNAQLRAAQMKLALNGNPTMQIWLGKQMLGQRDRPAEREPGVPPVVVQNVASAQAAASAAVDAPETPALDHDARLNRVQALLAAARARLPG